MCSLAPPAALLGNTVLHLDKALAKIREYERMKLKSEFNPRGASPAGAADLSNAAHPAANSADNPEGTVVHQAAATARTRLLSKIRNYSLFVTEGASADVRCPQIDTQQLDCQIKAIIAEVIPFFKVSQPHTAVENNSESPR